MRRYFRTFAIALVFTTTSVLSVPAIAGDRCTDQVTARCSARWQALGYTSFTDCRKTLIEGGCQTPDTRTWEVWCFDNPPGYADVCIIWP